MTTQVISATSDSYSEQSNGEKITSKLFFFLSLAKVRFSKFLHSARQLLLRHSQATLRKHLKFSSQQNRSSWIRCLRTLLSAPFALFQKQQFIRFR